MPARRGAQFNERRNARYRAASSSAASSPSCARRAIAETLGISDGTVAFHLEIIFDKAGVDNRGDADRELLEM